jgi:hypothetical protein
MFVARRSFLHNGKQYTPGDTVKGFPEKFEPRPESFLRAGMIDEVPDKRRAKPVMEEVKPE